jgi:hypothetical protein
MSSRNREQVVLAPSHPDCRACDILRDKVDRQAVANGRLRLQVMDLKAALAQTGGVLGHRISPDSNRGAAGTEAGPRSLMHGPDGAEED